MNVKEIIKSLNLGYDSNIENLVIREVLVSNSNNLSEDLADILAVSITNYFNKLAITILEKDYGDKKIDLNELNKAVINQSEERYSLIHFAAQFGNKEILLYFIENGIEISNDKDNLSPLHVLSYAKNLKKVDYREIIKALLKKEPKIINQKCIYGLTALHYAAHQNNKDAIAALISLGADSK